MEPHDLELAPDDIETIATADMIVYLGGGFQPAVEDALAEAEHAVTVDALKAVATNAAPASEAEEGLTVDPHVWLDPARYEEIVRAVADALSKADPANEATYAANADAYIAEIAALDDEFRSGLSDCERTTIVTSHEAFGYLADAYGLTQVGILGAVARGRARPAPARRAPGPGRAGGRDDDLRGGARVAQGGRDARERGRRPGRPC